MNATRHLNSGRDCAHVAGAGIAAELAPTSRADRAARANRSYLGDLTPGNVRHGSLARPVAAAAFPWLAPARSSATRRGGVLSWCSRLGSLAAAILVLSGCGNMKKQRYLRPETPSMHLPRGTSAQLPPPHTEAHRARVPDAVFETGERGGQLVTEIPIPVTRELLRRGQDRFTIYCAVCHGADGYGRGIVVQRGFPTPPSYHDARLLNAPVGHFFRVMTRGYGVMYSYADRLTTEDRWAVAAYIRALQLSQRANAKDMTDADRTALARR